MSRLSNFVFTVNHYDDNDIEKIKSLSYRYLIYGREKGESGTPHLQGYCELTKQTSFSTVKRCIPKAHIEKRNGTAVQASDYCKKDGDYDEFGKISNPGKRNDIHQVYEMVKEAKSDYEIQEFSPLSYAKYHRAIDRMRLNVLRENREYKSVRVTVIIGPTGAGKSRRAREIDPNLYQIMTGDDKLWFDGYTGQKTVLLDDFYGGIKYGYFLNLIDGYPFQLPIKGGFTWKNWEHVIITSNDHPEQWYTRGFTPALQRRVSELTYVAA